MPHLHACLCAGAALLAACGSTGVQRPASPCARLSSPAGGAPAARVLVFTKTAGYRHASIPAGVAAVTALGVENGFAVEQTEDAAVFRDAELARFRAVVLLSTTGDVLDAAQQDALQRYVRGGGGVVGVHAAADAEYDWPWYGALIGAWFKSHPAVQQATVQVVDTLHPSTRCLPRSLARTDEWYDFRAQPAAGARVLATLDESTYQGGTMGAQHPIAWYHHYDGGRAWYTAMGHTSESYSERAMLDHLLGGILWAAGLSPDTLAVR